MTPPHPFMGHFNLFLWEAIGGQESIYVILYVISSNHLCEYISYSLYPRDTEEKKYILHMIENITMLHSNI